jgi:hypothetical protein
MKSDKLTEREKVEVLKYIIDKLSQRGSGFICTISSFKIAKIKDDMTHFKNDTYYNFINYYWPEFSDDIFKTGKQLYFLHNKGDAWSIEGDQENANQFRINWVKNYLKNF